MLSWTQLACLLVPSLVLCTKASPINQIKHDLHLNFMEQTAKAADKIAYYGAIAGGAG